MTFVLVHSPLVGPGTWAPVARELERRHRRVVVVSLLDANGAPPQDWRACVDAVGAAVRETTEEVVLVGHSGGGTLLPVIAEKVAAVAGLIFVDSWVPARSGATPFVPTTFLGELRTLANDGVLPPWWRWFGERVMRDLVPNDALRAGLKEEMPLLPLAFLEQQIPSPPDWDRIPCAYLLFSDAYVAAAIEARSRGWTVEEISEAQHLHLVVAPLAVADALLRLAGDLRRLRSSGLAGP